MINVPPTSDHAEVDLGPAAGVTDRGLRHLRNEDAVALGSQQTPGGLVVVAVVCDGVSSSPRPDEASQAAARASLPVLLEAVRDSADLAEACVAAVAAARASVAGLGEPENERSATTFLSAVAARDQVTLCWLGDSRAYWLAPAESELRPSPRSSPATTRWPRAWSKRAWPLRMRPWPCPTRTC